jgi:O-antigen/teichoic acid export membrane protein
MAMTPFLEKIKKTDSRTLTVGKNILFSVLLKVIGLGCSLLIVPVTLHYIEGEQYGIWLTLSSVLFWTAFFDIGLGNGLRNYLTQSIAMKDETMSRTYISTTLCLLLIITLAIGAIILLICPLLHWQDIFNTRSIAEDSLRDVVMIAFLFTLANFLLKNVGIIYVALQKYAVNDLLIVSGNLLALGIIYLLTLFTEGSLLVVTLTFTATPVIVFITAVVPLFSKHPELKPSIKNVDFKLSSKLMGKGISFFFIQITSCLVIFGSANLFIANYCGPFEVTTYNLAYKYFNMLAIAYTIFISPLWSAYTEAYVKKDFTWIKSTFSKSLIVWGISVIGGLILLMFSTTFYRLWVGEDFIVPMSISISVLVFICSYNLNNCATYLINGLNHIRVQLYTSVLSTFLYFLLVKYYAPQYGVEGISLCMSGCYLFMSTIHLYQCYLLIQHRAHGIWIK